MTSDATTYVAARHQVHPWPDGGYDCLCGVHLGKSRDVSEHIAGATVGRLREVVRRGEAINAGALAVPGVPHLTADESLRYRDDVAAAVVDAVTPILFR